MTNRVQELAWRKIFPLYVCFLDRIGMRAYVQLADGMCSGHVPVEQYLHTEFETRAPPFEHLLRRVIDGALTRPEADKGIMNVPVFVSVRKLDRGLQASGISTWSLYHPR